MTRIVSKLLIILFAASTCDAWHQGTIVSPEKTVNAVVPIALPEKIDVKEEQTEIASQIPDGSSILLIGDSLALGLSAQFESLALKDGYLPTTHAKIGTRVDQWVKKANSLIELHRPKLVLISLGTNEILMGSSWIKQHEKDYRALVEAFLASGSKVVWISPPNLDEKIFLHAHESRLAITGSAPIVFESQKISIPRAADGVHSSAGGYKKWMDAVWNWLIDEKIVKTKT